MMTDEYYMRCALEQARQALERDEIPIGAVVVCEGRIIARGSNMTEMLAITSAASLLHGKYLTQCTLYVTVEPCVMCAGAIGWAQISRVVYGASDPKRGFTVFAPKALHPRTQVAAGILEEECAALMRDFFQSKR